MISSMTGFGRGESELEEYQATVELRSVNNRYCEVTTRLPKLLVDREASVQKMIKAVFARGRINVQLKLELPPGRGADLVVDETIAADYYSLLESLRRKTGIEDPVRLDHLLKNPDLFRAGDADESLAENAWTVTKEAITKAAEEMHLMRVQEGQALETELRERIEAIGTRLLEIEEEAPKRLPAAGEKLRSRLAEIVEDDRIDNDRLEFEMAILADKLDVREECVRLHSHLDLFQEALDGDKPVGRKLNFLSQEMNREINTIGSKANDAGLSHLVVEMKEDLEKIREQVENVE
ncbi:MAG: YicC family protein [Rhodothermia bacterium]|nr:MAG: YicC family protein [Rhodothermia bacterium]